MGEPSPPPELAPGARVDRYVIVQPIAQGGMGSVSLAYDTQLARKVAIKVLLTSAESDEARARMLREAQAMAQLAHPNVVAVYDVGARDGDIFLAMEFVDGLTLGAWLKTRPPVSAVLETMKQAGRGLAAAHAAGIVHRDFKPANVLVGRDGRARVLDFGIARGAHGGGPDEPGPAPAPSDSAPTATSRFSEALTEVGATVGTLGYMAPEQLAGKEVDARADVFAFSVTLWRGLFGVAPFPGDTPAGYRAALRAGPTRGPHLRRVPGWLEQVVRRGLAYDREERFPSMGAMLEALDADPGPRRLVLGSVAAAVVAASLVAGILVTHRRAVAAECVAEGAVVRASWSAAKREAVRQAMRAGGAPFADEASERVTAALDRYAGAWEAEQTASCRATRVAGTQSKATHEARTGCLRGDRQGLEAAVELLSSDDRSAHRHALALAQALSPPKLCTARTAEAAALPSAPGAREKAEDGRRVAARAAILNEAGRSQEALAALTLARTEAHDAGDVSGEAQALRLTAGQLQQDGKTDEALGDLLDALVLTERIGDDRQGGLCAARVASIVSGTPATLDAALGWLDLARAKLSRIGGDPVLEQAVLFTEAMIDQRRPETAARAYALWGELSDKLRALYGESSRACAALTNRGVLAWTRLDPVAATSDTRDAIACEERLNGPHSAGLGINYANYAEMLAALDRYDEALAAARHATEIRRESDPRSPALATSLALEAMALSGLGQLDEAGRAASAAVQAAGGARGQLPTALYALGSARAALGDAAGARDACEQGAAIEAETAPPRADTLYEYDLLRCAGEAELAIGDATAAREHLERSVALPRRAFAGDLARARFALARALAGPGGDPARARALADDAARELREAVRARPSLEPQLRGVEAWSRGR